MRLLRVIPLGVGVFACDTPKGVSVRMLRVIPFGGRHVRVWPPLEWGFLALIVATDI